MKVCVCRRILFGESLIDADVYVFTQHLTGLGMSLSAGIIFGIIGIRHKKGSFGQNLCRYPHMIFRCSELSDCSTECWRLVTYYRSGHLLPKSNILL